VANTNPAHSNTIAEICRLIDQADELPSVDALAQSAGISRFHFQRIFKAVTGLTPKAYLDARRAERVRQALNEETNITDALYDAGFNANSRFYSKSADILGMTPTAYRKGGRGETIRFALGESTLGTILVAASDKGVCAIALGDDPEQLLRELQDQFHLAELVPGDKKFNSWVAKVVGYVEAPRTGLDLPLDIRGTAFQRRVWQALTRIPSGTTASYTEVATSIGAPTSARAVARACASNMLALAIPCHRVVRTDGALSGYRWGVERKKLLLEREIFNDKS
jgi:AraC family transcriptional regulator, regulatory protein of adaptative response / methylated-DNA-[protein]-cysteine methyltransferase